MRTNNPAVNFQQLRSVRETVRRGFNLTEVAQALHTSQPGVSRQIRELETELGVEIFVRAGKRLTGLTAPGEVVLPIVERLLNDADNLRRAGEDFAAQDRGTLVIAATHSQARYALPPAVRDFRATHPQVVLQMHQGSPQQVAQMLLSGEADIGIHRRQHDIGLQAMARKGLVDVRSAGVAALVGDQREVGQPAQRERAALLGFPRQHMVRRHHHHMGPAIARQRHQAGGLGQHLGGDDEGATVLRREALNQRFLGSSCAERIRAAEAAADRSGKLPP